MRLLLDINILLDLAFQRPGAPASAAVIAACGRQHQGWLAWHTLATLAYLIRTTSLREDGAGVHWRTAELGGHRAHNADTCGERTRLADAGL